MREKLFISAIISTAIFDNFFIAHDRKVLYFGLVLRQTKDFEDTFTTLICALTICTI